MKRKLTVLFVLMMTMVLAFSLVACNPNTPSKPSKEVPQAKTQTDTRQDCYVAYKADGTKIGEYKTIAAAINAAVATDTFGSDNAVRENGSYVETKDGGLLFQNHNGFAEASDDQFWFYLNGTQLEAYDCYDNLLYTEYLKGSKVITHEVTARGSAAKQYHNGYALFGPDGQPETEKSAQSWELSSTMDAAALGMPARLKGVSGLKYEMDLTEVQIKPNYEGTDDTYAFIGYYAWQDYYVIATGIACNVQTGAWYRFEGTSRDDSFSDVQYNIGDEPLMISNWNEEGGYWTPEYAKLVSSIKTVRKSDDLGDYFVDETRYEFYTADGKLDNEMDFTIDESVITNHFSGVAFDANNTFAFITGLDIRTPASTGVHSLNTDYTNGAEFKNLKVTAAIAHVAGEDEITDVDYGNAINAEWKGKDFNILMASGEHEEGVYDYTILNTYACADYQAKDGCDVYSFSYAMANSAETTLGGIALGYQNKIDALKSATAENVIEMEEQINEVAAMYANGDVKNSTIAQKFYNVLDFAPLAPAQRLFAENTPLSADGEAFKAAFNELPSLTTYNYVGWSTDAEDDAGYLMNDVADFKAIYNEYYTKLSATDLERLKNHVNINDLDMYIDLMNKASDYFAVGFKFSGKVAGASTTAKEFTGEEAFAEIALYLNMMAKGTSWEGTELNDDPNNGKNTNICSDSNWLPGYHVFYLKARLEDAGYQLPLYFEDLFNRCGVQNGFIEDFKYIDTVLTLAAGINNGTIVVVNEKVAQMVNSVMVGREGFTEAGLAWNWNASAADGKDFLYRSKVYKAYYGLDSGVALMKYIKNVQDFLVSKVGAEANDTIGIKANVEKQEVTVSEAAKAVMALFNKSLIHGAAFDAYDSALEEFNKLSAEDQAMVAQLSDYEYIVELMEGHKNALEAVVLEGVEPITVYEKIFYNQDTAKTQMSAKDALYQLNELICKIEASAKFQYGVDSDCGEGFATMDFDHVSFASIRIVALRQYFEKAGVKLPTYFNDIYTKIAYDTFFASYDSIYQTVRLATVYAQEGKTVADMTEADKAVFERYWGPDYPLNQDALLNWNWNSGNKFETYFSARVAAIALQYALETETVFGEQFVAPKTRKWIYGQALEQYSYKGNLYWAYKYEDEALEDNRVFGALSEFKEKDKCWNNYNPVYIDAEGNITTETEGATMLTTSTEGVTKTDFETWQENCAGDETIQYVTEDGQYVYKRRVWRPTEEGGAYIDYDAEDFVDAYNRTVELTEEQLAKVRIDGAVKVYKFYDVLGEWLTAQGYTVKANGWGYETAPQA